MAKKDGAQSTPKFTTAEQQNELRRAAKARQRSNRSSTPGKKRTSNANGKRGFAWSPEGYKDTPLYQANRPKVSEEPSNKDDFKFTSDHAWLALQHPAITRLAVSSPARLLADEVLMQYPLAQRTEDMKRTDVAIQQAVEALTPEGTTRFTEGVITRVTWSVKTALCETFQEARQRPRASA